MPHIASSSGVSRQPEQARHLKSPSLEASSQSETTSHSSRAAVAFTVSSAICSGERTSEIASANSSQALACAASNRKLS